MTSTLGRKSVKPVAFVQACWHRELVDRCRDGFVEALGDVDPDREVELFEVPGSFELPLHAQLLARSGRYDAVVAAGLVVDGGIYRHEFVAHAVITGLMEVQLRTGVPVLSAVLTPHHFHEHEDHRQFFADHLIGKGREAANACAVTCAKVAGLVDA